MHPHRTTIANNIVVEFFPPYLGEKSAKENRVIIFCDGLPGMPGNAGVMEHFSKKGFWTLFPRYRGTWESGGELLAHEPTQDILDVISALDEPLISAWDDSEHKITDPEIFLIGCSFGGPAAILGSKDPRVKKAVSLSGVIDWPACEPYEPMDWLAGVIEQGYGQAYRFKRDNWDRLAKGELYNPIDHIASLASEKILLIHAQDDDVVPIERTRVFAQNLGCRLIELKRGKHVSTSALKRWWLSWKVRRFLKT